MSTAINSKFLQSLVGDLLGDTTQYSVDAAAASLPTGFRLNNIGDTATLQAAIAIDASLASGFDTFTSPSGETGNYASGIVAENIGPRNYDAGERKWRNTNKVVWSPVMNAAGWDIKYLIIGASFSGSFIPLLAVPAPLAGVNPDIHPLAQHKVLEIEVNTLKWKLI